MTLEFDDKGIYEVLHKYHYKLSDPCIEALIRKTAVGKEFFSKLLGLSVQNFHRINLIIKCNDHF